ncbi:hypothetical protein M0P65_00095 [Candidatus Gracilibacteria bacterium]|nr:hypothetical protein [Candidatus Gracilibacteria bacterium]
MTTITFTQDIQLKKTIYKNVLDFIEELEDYYLGEIIQENEDTKTFDIKVLEKKYLGK